jgi:hypothetical protein
MAPAATRAAGLARARALEHIANVGAIVFDGACQIGVPGTRPRHHGPQRSGGACRRLILRMHRLLPVLPVLVAYQQRDRRAQRFARSYAGQNLGFVGFDRHTPSAPVPALTPLELLGDGVEIDMKPGRHALENHDQAFAVGLTGGEKTQHCLVILYEVSAASWRGLARSRPFSRASRLQ